MARGSADGAAVAAALAAAADPAITPADAEARAYERWRRSPGLATQPNPREVQVTRLEWNDGSAAAPVPFALLVQCSEPIDWARTHLEGVARRARGHPRGTSLEAKVTEAVRRLAAGRGVGTLLLREALNLKGYRVEFSALPAQVVAADAEQQFFADEFDCCGRPALPRRVRAERTRPIHRR